MKKTLPQPEESTFTQALFTQLATRFPEIGDRIQADADRPYVLMNHLAEWLAGMGNYSPELIERLARFSHWCEAEPRGGDAADDPLTILVVGFYECLFESERTQALLPRIASRKTLLENADYFKAWIGDENYRRAIEP
jgi:hypothetical protein